MRAGKHVVSRQQAAAGVLTARSCGASRARATACSCASRAPWRASCRSSACCRSRSRAPTWSASTGSSTARRTSSSPRWPAAGASYEERAQRAQELGYAEADPTDDVTGRDAAAKMAILARLAFSTPVHLDQVTYEGIEHITPEDVAYARDLGLGLKLIGTAERVDGGISVRVHPAFLYPGHPLATRQRLVQRRHGRVRRDHRDHALRPRRGRPADRERGAGRRHQRDDPARLDARDDRGAADRHDVENAFYLRWRSTTSPACSRRWPRCWACRARRSSRCCSAGLGDPRAADDGPAPAAGVALLRRAVRADLADGVRPLRPPAADPRSSTRSSSLTGIRA